MAVVGMFFGEIFGDYEIKSGKTYSPQWAKHLCYLRDLLGERVQTTAVIYDGDENNLDPNGGFVNCRQASRLLIY